MNIPPLPNDIPSEIDALQRYRRALRREDQNAFDTLFDNLEKYRLAIEQTGHMLPIEAILLTLLVEQQLQITRILTKIGVDIQNLPSQLPLFNHNQPPPN